MLKLLLTNFLLVLCFTTFAQADDFATIMIKAGNKPVAISINGDTIMKLQPGKTFTIGNEPSEK